MLTAAIMDYATDIRQFVDKSGAIFVAVDETVRPH